MVQRNSGIRYASLGVFGKSTFLDGVRKDHKIFHVAPLSSSILDFEAGTFVRTSRATWFDSSTATLYSWQTGSLRDVTTQFPTIRHPSGFPFYAFEGSRIQMLALNRTFDPGGTWTASALGVLTSGSGDRVDGTGLVYRGAQSNATHYPAVQQRTTLAVVYAAQLLAKKSPANNAAMNALFGSGVANQNIFISSSNLTDTWQRFRQTGALGATTTYVAPNDGTDRSGIGGYGYAAQDFNFDFVQLEQGGFCTSFIESSGSQATTRQADNLTFTTTPDAFNSMWKIGIRPTPTSNQMIVSSTSMIIVSTTNNKDRLIFTSSGGTISLQLYADDVLMVDLPELTWDTSEQEMTIIANPITGELILSGTSGGIQEGAADPWIWSTANPLRVGASVADGSNPFFGLMTEPYA